MKNTGLEKGKKFTRIKRNLQQTMVKKFRDETEINEKTRLQETGNWVTTGQ
jgi:hypothetical protein